jgi:hypothetical protein
VHGPNSDVDLVNELAQHKRLDGRELGEQAVRAVDRDYQLHPGDLVAVRNAAYTFDKQPGKPRPKRIENGQVAIVESVDPNRDTLTLLLHEPGTQARLVKIDQARLRAEHAAGKRAAAIRLNYALHSFPAQGATVHATATLAGHWSQAKQETYVGDTRAIYRHTVHLAREDLGTDGTDQDRIRRYAQRISENRQRHASVRQALDPTQQLAVRLPDPQPMPRPADPDQPPVPRDASPEPSPSSTRDTSPSAAAPAAANDLSSSILADSDPGVQQHVHVNRQLARLLADLPEHQIRALGPVPQERVAKERWEREARRLAALGPQAETRSAPVLHTTGRPALAPRAPSSPPTPPQLHNSPTIDR